MIGIPLTRSWLAGAVLLATGFTGVSGVTGTGGAPPAVAAVPSGAPVSDARAVGLLRAAYEAGRSLGYQGPAVVVLQGSALHLRLRHVPGRGTYVSTPGAAAGSSALQPDARPSSALDPLAMLQDNYQLTLAGTARTAGRSAYVVQALRPHVPGAAGVAARFWIDRRTGLVLARAAYDDAGREYERLAFTAITVDGAGGLAVPRLGAPLVAGAAPAVDAATAARLRDEGWHVRRSLPEGFELYDARVDGSGRAAVLHLSYSDGLCSLSLFEQRGRLVARALAGWREAVFGGRTVYVDPSTPQRLAWQGRDTVYALMSDAAAARVAGVVAALPAGGPPGGVVDRMVRGFDRLGSWLDPFG